MIFGSAIMVDDKGGLTSEGGVKNDATHPEYEYRMATLSMSSRDVVAVTNCGVSSHKFDVEPLQRGDYSHHIEMFEKSISLSRYIKANIDINSISDRLYCITNKDGMMMAVSPSSIQVSIREITDGDKPNIYCGEFYFDDENEKREYPFKQGDNTLSISLNLDSESFSRIFERLSGGDNFIDLGICFPAYASWLDRMAASLGTTYIIYPTREDENFIVISSILATKGSIDIRTDNDKEDTTDTNYLHDDNKISELNDTTNTINATNELLSVHAANTKNITLYLAIMTFCLVILAIKSIF